MSSRHLRNCIHWIVSVLQGDLLEQLGQLPDVLLRHLQGLVLGQLVVCPQAWQDPSQAVEALVQQIHPSSLASVCCQPPFFHHRVGDAIVAGGAHLAHLAAVHGQALGALLHLVTCTWLEERARPAVAQVDRAGDLLQGEQPLPHLLQGVSTEVRAPVVEIVRASG